MFAKAVRSGAKVSAGATALTTGVLQELWLKWSKSY
jgi:hypothetical protein